MSGTKARPADKAKQANGEAKAGKRGGKRATSWKPGQSGNPAGRPRFHSLNWHVAQRFTDDDRAQAIDAQILLARCGDGRALELLAKLGGEAPEAAAPANVNVLALINAEPELRKAAQRLFAALPLGAGDAGGMGGVLFSAGGHDEAGLDRVAAPDADQ